MVSLVVNDVLLDGAPDTATIPAAATSAIVDILRQAMGEINRAPDGAFKNPKNSGKVVCDHDGITEQAHGACHRHLRIVSERTQVVCF